MTKIVVALVLIMGSELSIRMITQSMTPAQASLPARPLSGIAQQCGGWRSQEIELDPRVFASSGAAESVKRAFRNDANDQISFFAGIWLDYPPSIPHSPQICYPANGWDIGEQESVRIAPEKESPFEARLMMCKKTGSRVAVLYWIDIDGNRTFDDESIRQALQRSRREGKPRPPMIKVMLQCDGSDPVAAKRHLVELASSVASELSAITK